MTYRLVVPSLGRADSIVTDTLAVMCGGGVPQKAITVLAGPPAAAPTYAAVLADRYPDVTVLPCPMGLHSANRLIADLYRGQWVVRADDDIRAMLQLDRSSGRPRVVPLPDCHSVFTRTCRWADANAVTLWGVSPTSNPLYMGPGRKTGLYFADGTLTGYRPHPDVTPQLSCKEDYERTLLHFMRDGAVGRVNHVAYRSRPLRGFGGGMQSELPDRRAGERAAVDRLLRLYPGLVHRRADRDGYPEIALRLPVGVPTS